MKKQSGVNTLEVSRSGGLGKRVKSALKDWRLWLLLLPAIIYLFVFAYLPMYGVQIAFKDYSARAGIWGSKWVGLKYFKKFISHPNFKLYLMNTLRLGLYALTTFVLPIIFALMLNEVRNLKFKKTVQMISYMPHFLSVVVVCSMVTLFFNEQTGFVNTIIKDITGKTVPFLTKAALFDDVYVWSGAWQGLGWGAIIYTAALSGVPSELVDAAKIDGANRMQIIKHVNIPHILPTIVIMLIFACGGILGNDFQKILLLQNDLNLSSSQVISTYVYSIGIRGGEFSYASAIGLFNNIISVIIIVIVNKVAKKVSDVGIW